MFGFNKMALRGPAAALSALVLTACATGQGSFVAGSGGGGNNGVSEEAFDDGASLDEAAPGLLAASGNALLPGVRSASRAAVAVGVQAASGGSNLLATGPVAANGDASINLLGGAPAANVGAALTTSLAAANVGAGLLGANGALSANLTTGLTSPLASTNVAANVNAPLLALNGSPSALLGVGVAGPMMLGATPNLNLNVGGALNPATAATQTLISASVGATQQPSRPSQPTSGQPPLLPPVLGVPGTTPLQTLLPMLTSPLTPKSPVLPGLLGQ